jgi:perosamine synthetase
MEEKLALFGGKPVRSKPFPPHPIIGGKEKKAALQVLDSGRLSTFIASPGKHFLGGEKIREFEDIFAEYHSVEYAVAFNSATAALHAAVVACNVEPLKEVVVPPYTFTSTATCALMANAIPVFADVKQDTFNIDPGEIEKKISPLSKAIIPVHLFGYPADMDEIIEIAKKHNLKVIEDCAQAPGAIYNKKLVGTLGDCGIFSFTESKTITSGEGGMLITNCEEIAEIARLVRNHGEAVIAGQPRSYKSTILGWNYRMTEVDAAIGIEQFKKLDEFNNKRIELVTYLSRKLKKIDGLTLPVVPRNFKHVYYAYPIRYNEEKIGILRDLFVKALNAEGIPFSAGYVRPLYFNPIFHENRPFIYKYYSGRANYEKGTCPVAESLHGKELILTLVCRPPATFDDMNDIVEGIEKVIENKDELRAGK